MQVPYFPGWLEIFTLQLECKHRHQYESPDWSQSTWSSIQASFNAATAIVEGALGLPPQQAAAHHQRALQLLRNWETGKQVPDFRGKSVEGSGTGAGPGDAAVQPPDLFSDTLRLLSRVPSVQSRGPRLALELEALISQMSREPPPGVANIRGSIALVDDNLAQRSATETCTIMGLEISDGLPMSAPFAVMQ